MLQIVIRTDASPQIGIGHMMRCLTLADMLSAEGASISFVSRGLPDVLREILKDRQYSLYELDSGSVNDAEETIRQVGEMGKSLDWLIVDHYNIDYMWERELHPFFRNICVIDDLANRKHDCDFLLDQNYYKNLYQRYDDLVPEQCQKLLGPSYVLLRPEFAAAAHLAAPRTKVKRVLVTFGGSDPTDETSKVLDLIEHGHLNELYFNIVVGSVNGRKEALAERCRNLPNTIFLCDVNNMAELMLQSDVAIGAGGITMWERMMLGLPTILIVVADNQRDTAVAMEEKELIVNLGWHSTTTSANILAALQELIRDEGMLTQLSLASMNFMNKAHNQRKHPLIEAILGGV